MIFATRRKQAREIDDLNDRVTGMETLLADLVTDGRIVVQLPRSAADEQLGRRVERESVRARGGAAWRRS